MTLSDLVTARAESANTSRFGALLYLLRVGRDYTQKELALRAGFSASKLGAIESGEVPSEASLVAICAALPAPEARHLQEEFVSERYDFAPFPFAARREVAGAVLYHFQELVLAKRSGDLATSMPADDGEGGEE